MEEKAPRGAVIGVTDGGYPVVTEDYSCGHWASGGKGLAGVRECRMESSGIFVRKQHQGELYGKEVGRNLLTTASNRYIINKRIWRESMRRKCAHGNRPTQNVCRRPAGVVREKAIENDYRKAVVGTYRRQ